MRIGNLPNTVTASKADWLPIILIFALGPSTLHLAVTIALRPRRTGRLFASRFRGE